MLLPSQNIGTTIINYNIIQRIITGFVLVSSLWLLFFYCSPITLSLFITICMLIMLAELKKMIPSPITCTLLALFYPIIPCLILIYFNHSALYKNLLPAMCLIVFTFDTTCYLAGSLFSRFWTTHKILPAISPGKSWEGFFAGLFATTSLLCTISNQSISSIIIFSLAICIVAFSGDMFESYLKRTAKIKDSGSILPGHGGMLDRFDAILAVSYFFFIFKNYLITLLL